MMASPEKLKTIIEQMFIRLIKEHENSRILSLIENYEPDSFYLKLLHYASEYGNNELVEYFLEKGWKIDSQNRDGCTPLMLSVKEKHMKIIDVLLNANADIEIRNVSNKNVLHLVMDAKFCAEIVMKFIKQLEKKYNDETLGRKLHELDCPLPYAIFLNNTKVTKTMLELGSFVNTKVKNNYTALHVAAALTDLSNIELLRNYHADIDIGDEFQRTPLTYFLLAKHLDKAEIKRIFHMLVSETTLTKPDIFGSIPFFTVFIKRERCIIKNLLEIDIVVSARDKTGRSFLHYLLENRDPQVLDDLALDKIDINVVDSKGLSPLHIASMNGSIYAVNFLVQNGANLRLKTRTPGQLTALDLAKRRYTISPSDDVKKCIEILEKASLNNVFY